jgi:hypothetical protein
MRFRTFGSLAGLAALALAGAIVPASADAITADYVSIDNPSIVNISIPNGLNGKFYAGQVNFYDNGVLQFIAFCDDLYHEMVLGGQNPALTYLSGGPVLTDSNGTSLSALTQDKIGYLASIGLNTDPLNEAVKQVDIWNVVLKDTDSLVAADLASLDTMSFTGNFGEVSYTTTHGQGMVGVPEPATIALFFGGLGALGFVGWRRRTKASGRLALA